eukprot:14356864-Alexandrium_andersonii.AAC.1
MVAEPRCEELTSSTSKLPRDRGMVDCYRALTQSHASQHCRRTRGCVPSSGAMRQCRLPTMRGSNPGPLAPLALLC